MTRLVSAALAGALAALSTGGAISAQVAPPAPPPVAEKTLPNGLRVVAIRNALSPVVSAWMNYRVGSDDDGGVPGIAHAAEHMMFRGSATVTGAQFADTMAVMGGNFNGETGAEVTSYRFEVPVRDLDVAMQLEASRCAGLANDPALWERERGAISQEVAQKNGSATYRLTTKMIANVLAGTPYANEGLGTLESFRRLTAAQLREFHAAYYVPSNAVYVIVGDVDPNDVIARAAAVFGTIPAGKAPERAPVGSPKPHPATIVDDQSALPVNYAVLGYRLPGYDDADHAAAAVLFDVLANERGPLRDLRDDGTVLRTYASMRSFPRASAGLVAASVPVSADAARAGDAVKARIAKLRANGIAPELVDAAKRRLLTEAAVAQSSIQEQARAWSEALAVKGRTPLDDAARIERVGAADVNRVLRASFGADAATVGIAVSKPGARPARSDANAPDRAAAMMVPSERGDLPEFARPLLAGTSVPEAGAPPYETVLANGLRLVVVTNTATEAVVVRGLVRTDPELQEPDGREGVARVLGALYEQSPGGLDAAEYSRRVDALGAGVWSGADFGTDLRPERFEDAMQLLGLTELHPALDETSVRAAVRRVAGELQGTVATPAFRANQALCRALYGARPPHCRAATAESVTRIQPADVAAYYARTIRPERTTIVVVGDVGAQRARAAVERAFGAWQPAGAPAALDTVRSPLNRASETVLAAEGRVQASVTLAQLVPLVRHDDDYVALRVANALLTGGAFGSLLYEDLREQKGYVYTVASQIQTGSADSVFAITFGADPKNVRTATESIRARLRDLQQRPVDERRLARTKALILSDIPLAMESYAGVANRILFYARSGMPADNAYREAHRVLATTPEDVRAAAAKYIRPDGLAQVIEGPAGLAQQ